MLRHLRFDYIDAALPKPALSATGVDMTMINYVYLLYSTANNVDKCTFRCLLEVFCRGNLVQIVDVVAALNAGTRHRHRTHVLTLTLCLEQSTL